MSTGNGNGIASFLVPVADAHKRNLPAFVRLRQSLNLKKWVVLVSRQTLVQICSEIRHADAEAHLISPGGEGEGKGALGHGLLAEPFPGFPLVHADSRTADSHIVLSKHKCERSFARTADPVVPVKPGQHVATLIRAQGDGVAFDFVHQDIPARKISVDVNRAFLLCMGGRSRQAQ
jgi:hypothetical protein